MSCFAEVEPTTERCAACGAPTESDWGSYEDKLVRALDHHLSDRRLLAARILGKLGSRVAVPRLVEVATNEDDPYLAAEAARSLALIEPEHPVVRWIRDSGPLLAKKAVREVSA
jgi:DNA-directed RNA polymerase subunit N (RpoN/RPB10)